MFQGVSHAVSWRSGFESAIEESQKDGKPVMAYFYGPRCGWCKKMDADTFSDANINRLAANFICLKIDATRYSDIASRYGVEGFPTIVFLNPGGSVIETAVGYRPPNDFGALMSRISQKFGGSGSYIKPLKTILDSAKAIKQKASDKSKEMAAKLNEKKPEKITQKIGDVIIELDGIVYDEKRPMAVINGSPVFVGDLVEGIEVVEITQRSVKLRFNDEDTIIDMQ